MDKRKLALLLLLLFKEDVAELARLLIAGTITLAMWQTRMKERIKWLLASGMVVARGWDDANWEEVEAEILRQYEYLAGFAQDIEGAGEAKPSIISRAKLYAGAGLAVFYRGLRELAGEEGKEEVLWVVNPELENCPDCLDLQSQDWIPIEELGGQVPGDGQTQCRTNCGCHLEFR